MGRRKSRPLELRLLSVSPTAAVCVCGCKLLAFNFHLFFLCCRLCLCLSSFSLLFSPAMAKSKMCFSPDVIHTLCSSLFLCLEFGKPLTAEKSEQLTRLTARRKQIKAETLPVAVC